MTPPDRMTGIISRLRGLRTVRQDPVECLPSFICSSNRNSARIQSMTDKHKAAYGDLPERSCKEHAMSPAGLRREASAKELSHHAVRARRDTPPIAERRIQIATCDCPAGIPALLVGPHRLHCRHVPGGEKLKKPKARQGSVTKGYIQAEH
jgi:hypothetical protein